MKKILVSSMALCAILCLNAARLDMVSQARLRLDRLEQKGRATTDNSRLMSALKKQLGVSGTASLAMVEIADSKALDELTAGGVQILRQRGNFVLMAVPTDDVERVAAMPSIRRMQLARHISPRLDRARTASRVSNIHDGVDLPQTYTGKGVITGIVDGGVDPNHINFLDAEGNSRVKYLGHLRLNSAGTNLLETRYGELNDLPISTFTTDDPGQFHGTHTMGIMAGGYKGKATVANGDVSTGLADIADIDNPYFGVATESDIAVSCGDMMDMMIAMGIDDICEYAYRKGDNQRTVINLSLGSNTGPHDGSDIIHQFIDQIVAQDNAIICVSAGNEGDLPIALHGTFGDDCQELKSFVRPYVYTDLRYGNIVAYSEDATDFTIQAVVYNRSRGRVAFSIPVAHSLDGSATYYISGEDMRTSDSDVVSTALARAFDGYVGVGSMYDQDNGRYYAMIDYYCINADSNADDNYLLGFIVQPNDQSQGKRVDIYGDGQFCAFDSYNESGWNDGMYDGTISDMACGKNVLAVGSYNTRDNWGALDGFAYGYEGMFTAGEITPFSSYGELADGRRLPHVCAPGAAIVSSANSYYVSSPANGITDSYLMAKATRDDKVYPWMQTTGTSMAAPYVAGSIALWLEADPTLTINDVKDIVAATAIRDAQVESTGTPLQWGAGKFDAFGGLKEVLRRKSAGVGNVVSDANNRLMVSAMAGGGFQLTLAGAPQMRAEMFDLSGRKVAELNTAGDELTISSDSLTSGIYVVRVNGSYTSKIQL